MCVPSDKALEFLNDEFGIFFHFGIRTFNEYNRDWDGKSMELETFNPTELDCRQWISEIKKFGAKYAVLTTKHHDGFALWPSAYTDYCVKNTPWKNGKGDVVREFTDACREYGIKIGLYYSCAQFSTKDMTNGQYNDFVAGQLHELFGGSYGKIDEIWFDGCGSEGFDFDADRMENILRELQPEALIFGGWGNDIGWIGNEWGVAPLDNTNNGTYKGEAKFIPNECDCTMIRKNAENFWFYNEEHREYIRTADELVGMYYNTIGRGANLLLNISPDRRGLLPQQEIDVIGEAYREIKRRFTECRLPFKLNEPYTANGKKCYVCSSDRNFLANQCMITENLADGEHIRSFTLYANPVNTERYDSGVMIYRGLTVGHKQICTFPTIRCKGLTVVLDDADDAAQISEMFAVYTESPQIN